MRAGWSLLPAIAACLFLAQAVSHAAPHVVGYERFHAEAPSVEGGAILFSELGCASCHGDSAVVVPRQGPNLIGLRGRADREWVREFLQDPEAGRSGSTMPGMFHGVSGEDLDDVLAYLGSLGKDPGPRRDRHANAERGSALYHEKGCVACHAPTPDYRGPEGRGDAFDTALAVAHPDFRKKTSLGALIAFLQAPSKVRVDGRMPHLPLENQEAVDIAAHLLDFQASDPREAETLAPWPEAKKEQIDRGKALVNKLNCASCHDLPGLEAAPFLSLSALSSRDGCLASDPVEGRPHYALTENQRVSLRMFFGGERPERDETGSLTLAAMNCYACHDRDGIGGPTDSTNAFFHGVESLGDSGRLPPPLTGIGHKLRADWMESVFRGEPDSRVRPYLRTVMPAYPEHAKELTSWLQEIDQPEQTTDIEVGTDDLEAGRKLLGISGGVNCITCHHWGESRSLGIPGPDLAGLDRRLSPSWFRDYLLNPASYRPGTLMPPLWPGGQSTVPDVLGGDTERQIAAIWGFIRDGEGIPEGFPDRSGGQFELVPEDRPLIQRTFLKGTGSRAILVGFPAGVHLAFDGASGHPSIAWRGRFFDAYDTWFTRAAPFEEPLGDDVVRFEESPAPRRFLGYRLGESGDPTFLLGVEGRRIEESFSAEDGTLVRTVRWTEGSEPRVGHPEGVELDRAPGENSVTFRYTWKP